MADDRDGGGDLPYYVREPQVMRLPTLLAAMREGSLRVPDFQRGFVWKASQRVDLFDSVARGFPIGTVLVWRTTTPEVVGTIDHLGPLRLPASLRRKGRPAELILDGQQRLTTLFTALNPDLPEQDGPWGSPDDLLPHAVKVFGSEPAAREWGVYVDVAADGGEDSEGSDAHPTFCLAPRVGPIPPHHVPLYLLLKNIPLYRFLAGRARFLNAYQIEQVERLASIFKDYSIPVVPIVTDDVATAVQSFERVNSRATKLTQFDIAHAFGRLEAFDLAGMFREIRGRLEGTGWGEVEDQTLGYTAKLAVGMQVYSTRTSAFVTKLAKQQGLAAQIGDAMARAVAFLRGRCGVHGASSIPYQFQLVLLAELFRLDMSDAFPALESGAERWFWMTTFSEHFASQRRINIALDRLVALACDQQPKRVVDDPHLDPLDRVAFNRARVKGFLLWFAKTFEPCDASGASLRAPHVLGTRGHEAVHALVPRGKVPSELQQRAGNVLLCDPESLTSLRNELLLHTDRCSEAFLRSHAITAPMRDLLREGRYAEFIEMRHAELDRAERSFATSWGLEYLAEPIRGDDGG